MFSGNCKQIVLGKDAREIWERERVCVCVRWAIMSGQREDRHRQDQQGCGLVILGRDMSKSIGTSQLTLPVLINEKHGATVVWECALLVMFNYITLRVCTWIILIKFKGQRVRAGGPGSGAGDGTRHGTCKLSTLSFSPFYLLFGSNTGRLWFSLS